MSLTNRQTMRGREIPFVANPYIYICIYGRAIIVVEGGLAYATRMVARGKAR